MIQESRFSLPASCALMNEWSSVQAELRDMNVMAQGLLYSWESVPDSASRMIFFQKNVGIAGRANTNLQITGQLPGNELFLIQSLRLRLRGSGLLALPISWLWDTMSRGALELIIANRVQAIRSLPAAWETPYPFDPPMLILPMRPFSVRLSFTPSLDRPTFYGTDQFDDHAWQIGIELHGSRFMAER